MTETTETCPRMAEKTRKYFLAHSLDQIIRYVVEQGTAPDALTRETVAPFSYDGTLDDVEIGQVVAMVKERLERRARLDAAMDAGAAAARRDALHIVAAAVAADMIGLPFEEGRDYRVAIVRAARSRTEPLGLPAGDPFADDVAREAFARLKRAHDATTTAAVADVAAVDRIWPGEVPA